MSYFFPLLFSQSWVFLVYSAGQLAIIQLQFRWISRSIYRWMVQFNMICSGTVYNSHVNVRDISIYNTYSSPLSLCFSWLLNDMLIVLCRCKFAEIMLSCGYQASLPCDHCIAVWKIDCSLVNVGWPVFSGDQYTYRTDRWWTLFQQRPVQVQNW